MKSSVEFIKSKSNNQNHQFYIAPNQSQEEGKKKQEIQIQGAYYLYKLLKLQDSLLNPQEIRELKP